MLKWIGYILLLALIVAMITAPSKEKFEKFAMKDTGDNACLPSVTYNSYKVIVSVFGIGYIQKCEKASTVYNAKTGKTTKMNVALPVYGKKQTYLGLFGTFWKL